MQVPVNYVEPSLIDYIVGDILASGKEDHWERMELGELVIMELDTNSINFELTDEEYEMLSEYLDKFIKEHFAEQIQDKLNERLQEQDENFNDYNEIMRDLRSGK